MVISFLRLMMMLSLLVVMGAASAADYRVTDDESLKSVLKKLRNRDTLTLAEGTYTTKIDIRRSVKIKGEGNVVIDVGGTGTGITLRWPNSGVENITVINYGGDLYKRDSGILIADGADGTTVKNVTLSGKGYGIRADRSQDIKIEHCTITGDRKLHIIDRGDGIFFNYVKKSKIDSCIIKETRDGIYLENTDKNLCTNNFFEGLQYGVHFMYSRDDKGLNNAVEKSLGGYAVMSSKRIEVGHNTTKDNVEFGILLNLADGCSIHDNIITGVHNPKGKAVLDTEGKGLYIYGEGASTVLRNRFAGADIGVGVALGGEGNILSGNAFIDNPLQVRYVGTAPLEWSHNGKGNFWSTYMGWDIDDDGISDRPFQPNDSLDRIFWIYPEAQFLMDSPVVALLRWLASQFEVDRGKGVTDSYPLMRAPMMDYLNIGLRTTTAGRQPN